MLSSPRPLRRAGDPRRRVTAPSAGITSITSALAVDLTYCAGAPAVLRHIVV